MWMFATIEPGMIGLIEPPETPRIRASESRSFSRFHDAPQLGHGSGTLKSDGVRDEANPTLRVAEH